jgi:chromosome segregation ATPase
VESLPIVEAAQRLGIHPETLRRRIRRGEVKAHQKRTPHGDVWMVEVALAEQVPKTSNQGQDVQDDVANSQANLNGDFGEVRALREMVGLLKDELEARDRQTESWKQQLEAKDKQIEQLHILLQQAQAALPAPRDNRPWWQRFWRRD